MLGALRGREHTVLTGVTVTEAPSGRRLSGHRSTAVRMRACSDEEIAAYVASGRPMDKAGAYAVQDADFRPAEAVSGCYLNVVGLPLCVVADLLGGFGVRAGLRDGWELPPQCGGCSLRGGAGMNLLGMGPLEIVAILLVAFIFLGPGRMAEAARLLGKMVGDLRRMSAELPKMVLEEEDAPVVRRADARPPATPGRR